MESALRNIDMHARTGIVTNMLDKEIVIMEWGGGNHVTVPTKQKAQLKEKTVQAYRGTMYKPQLVYNSQGEILYKDQFANLHVKSKRI